MSKHNFHLRLNCTYESSENKISVLDVEVSTEDGWQPLELSEASPGFLIYAYSIFTCQHTYMRLNAGENGLIIDSAEGELKLQASEEWLLESIDVAFDVKLKSGTVTDEKTALIIERMKQCPVSLNLPTHVAVNTTMNFS
jgi:uncharacterized OsmC-like protein